MKLFVKVLCFGLVLALAGPFLLRGPDGQPLYTPADAWRSLTAQMPSLGMPDVVPSAPVRVYRWRDADGQWHFAGEPPPDGTRYTVLEIDPKTNTVGAGPVVPGDDTAPEGAAAGSDRLGPDDAMLGPYPNPEAVRQLIEDAKALRAQSLERVEQLDGTP